MNFITNLSLEFATETASSFVNRVTEEVSCRIVNTAINNLPSMESVYTTISSWSPFTEIIEEPVYSPSVLSTFINSSEGLREITTENFTSLKNAIIENSSHYGSVIMDNASVWIDKTSNYASADPVNFAQDAGLTAFAFANGLYFMNMTVSTIRDPNMTAFQKARRLPFTTVSSIASLYFGVLSASNLYSNIAKS